MDYTKLSADEAIELAKNKPDIIFKDVNGIVWESDDVRFSGIKQKYTPFSAHKLIPYGEVSISSEAAKALKKDLIPTSIEVFGTDYVYAVIDRFTKGAD